jgi:serine/threonine protein kinase
VINLKYDSEPQSNGHQGNDPQSHHAQSNRSQDHSQDHEYQGKDTLSLGGTLPVDDPTYVTRQADDDLYQDLRAGKFCYVLNSRQMGKSSLELRVRKRLEAAGFACAALDLSLIGTKNISSDQWYASLISSLTDSFSLDFDLSSWWQAGEQQQLLTPQIRLNTFIETILLEQIQQNIVIVIDEIDSVLSLEFPADDFFVFIRACYNRRHDKPAYQRLTFVLIGVATPSDLIADRERTPFNIGRAIELYGFRPTEVTPLEKRLASSVKNPQAVLAEILAWTGGQPFLTQKLCKLILETNPLIAEGNESKAIAALVQAQILTNWESQDQPAHLKTISDRILRNARHSRGEPADPKRDPKDEQMIGRLLGLYQRILEQGQISADDSPEQTELRLSGLVVKQDGMLKAYNRVYHQVFNKQWVQDELVKLRPYREAINAWIASGYTDESRLLHGKALQDALIWAKGKQLSEQDQNFLDYSQAFAQISEAKPEVAKTLKQFIPKLASFTNRPSLVIHEVQAWAGSQPQLTELLCQLLVNTYTDSPFPKQTSEAIAQLIQARIVQNWETGLAREHLSRVQDSILEEDDERCVNLLNLYRQILQQGAFNSYPNLPLDSLLETIPELRSLLGLRLVEEREGQIKVANRIYAQVFNQAWIERELDRVKQRRTIRGRYEVIESMGHSEMIQTYLVKDRHLPHKDQYIIKEFTPVADDIETLNQTRDRLDEKNQELGRLNDKDKSPTLLTSFRENEKFYIVQEYIAGHNLDQEIIPGKCWNEAQTVDLLIEILEALEVVHWQNLAHLNLKPANLRRRQRDGKIVLIDFGILKTINSPPASSDTLQAQLIGTPGYVPPADYQDFQKISLDRSIDTSLEPSRFSRDIYAVGMIGIQAITGIRPDHLCRDKQTGEMIWLYSILPDQVRGMVKPELALILSKMIRHNPNDRYLEASEVLKSLRTLKHELSQATPPSKSPAFLLNKRLIAGGIAGLCLLTGLGYWLLQKNSLQRQVAQCNQPITLTQEANKANLINHQVIVAANQVIQACEQVTAKNQASSDSLKNRGKAALVLWKSELALGHPDVAKNQLNSALAAFQNAAEINAADPQTFFYMGLTQRLLGNTAGYAGAYRQAIGLYANKNTASIQQEDIPILVKLANFLSQEENDFDNANNILTKAETKAESVAADPKDLPRDLIYNQGSLHARGKSYPYARRFFERLVSIEPNNFYALRSLGFVYLLLDQTNEAQRAFDQALAVKEKLDGNRNDPYILKTCPNANQTQISACKLVKPLDSQLKLISDEIFPNQPVYRCEDYPVLAIAEPESSQSCR